MVPLGKDQWELQHTGNNYLQERHAKKKAEKSVPAHKKKHPYSRSVIPTTFDHTFLPEITKVDLQSNKGDSMYLAEHKDFLSDVEMKKANKELL